MLKRENNFNGVEERESKNIFNSKDGMRRKVKDF